MPVIFFLWSLDIAFYENERWPEKSEYYRWPWSNNDNPISWLEVTDICNIYCKGCYRANIGGERPLEVLKEEVDFFKRMRNASSISIAGGEPLMHKDIVPLVEYIAENGMLPTIISNTSLLTESLLKDLYNAGLTGLTGHIDMLQERPEFEKGRVNELDIMPLRQEVADMVYDIGRGNISCTFNSTIYHQNFQYMPDIVRWMRKNPKKVHGVVFITYRGIPIDDNISWDVHKEGAESIHDDREEIRYTESDKNQINIDSTDVYSYLKDTFGDSVELSAYLGGTGHIKHYKWMGLVTFIEGNGKVLGPLGPRTMEYFQMNHHFKHGTYFAYK
jgi:MoaA/NifB/PqqE/SkfB family radical SAM enzyme